ncbi:MAG: hypothetical protein V2I33_10020 [Kangiellaceae bacterium]|jgi:hypothetical protein|nr:hypothetical protein [Kangiellaceae bacterium]
MISGNKHLTTECCEITIEQGVSVITAIADVSYETVRETLDIVAQQFPYQRRLWDISTVHFDFNMQELMAISNHSNAIYLEPNKLAIFVTDELALAEMSQLIAFREKEGVSQTRAFKDKEQAMQWLLAD